MSLQTKNTTVKMVLSDIVLSDIFDHLFLGDVGLPGVTNINNIAVILDASGSTAAKLASGTVLDMEIEIAKGIASANGTGNTFLVTFDCEAKSLGRIGISSNGTVMVPPGIKPGGNTNTHLAFAEVLRMLPSTKVTKVYLITDGQLTDPHRNAETLRSYSKELRDKGVEIEVIAVSAKDIDFPALTAEEETRIPGLDVVYIIKSGALCYTPSHLDTPFQLATICDTSTRNWDLLGISIPKNFCPLPTIIMMIISGLLSADIDFSTPSVQGELQQLFIEIGMLLGLVSVKYPDFFTGILHELQTKTSSDLSEFVQYGFDLKKTNQPLVLANIARRIIENRDQKASFASASNSLEIKGTALDEPAISFMNGLVCFRVDVSSLEKNGIYSTDSAGNIFFAFDASEEAEQAIRQGLRSLFGEKYKFPSCRSNPSVIFGVASQIFLFMLSTPELTLDNEYIEKLRRLARIQIGQRLQNSDKSYGHSFAEMWLKGEIPVTHFTNTKETTHADCSTDTLVNPLDLPQTLWWAVMMMIFGNGLFEAQMPYYQEILRAEGIDPTEVSLFEHLRGRYSSKVTGTVKFLTSYIKSSLITMSGFLPGERVFEYLPHNSPSGQLCNTRIHCSEGELRDFNNKCLMCRQRLSPEQFKEVQTFLEDDLRNSDPARFISQVQTSRASAQVASHSASHRAPHSAPAQVSSGGGSTVFSSRLSSGGATTSSKRRIVMHVNFGKGKLSYDSYANAVRSAILPDSINGNVMDQDGRQRRPFLHSAVQQFQRPPANRTLSYVGGESDLVCKGDSYYFWGNILVGKIAEIEVQYVRY
jgi:hypothetical protein